MDMIMTLQEFMTTAKGWTYILMGVGLVFYVVFWLFLTDHDEKARYF